MALIVAGSPSRAQEEDAGYVKALSCRSGPFAVRLPKSYTALRRLSRLQREKVLQTTDHGDYRTYERQLRFAGLEIVVLTSSRRPNEYVLSRATIMDRRWRISGPLRVGVAAKTALRGLPLKQIPGEAELEFSGDSDKLRVSISAGRVQDFEYECHTD